MDLVLGFVPVSSISDFFSCFLLTLLESSELSLLSESQEFSESLEFSESVSLPDFFISASNSTPKELKTPLITSPKLLKSFMALEDSAELLTEFFSELESLEVLELFNFVDSKAALTASSVAFIT